jgi:hypothetical protein
MGVYGLLWIDKGNKATKGNKNTGVEKVDSFTREKGIPRHPNVSVNKKLAFARARIDIPVFGQCPLRPANGS